MRLRNTTAITIAASLCLGSQALAGDIAALNLIGFSSDGDTFAFEEFGIQDGSGFPYSNIYVIDTIEDTFIPGTPIRVRLDADASLGLARQEARVAAQQTIDQYTVELNPGLFAAFNPISETGQDPYAISYEPAQTDPPLNMTYSLSLETVAFSRPENCKDVTESYGGFRLRYKQIAGKKANKVVYEDTFVPESRGCVTGYRLGGIALAANGSGPHMAMVEVHTFGFEGNDGRWIAIPLRPGS